MRIPLRRFPVLWALTGLKTRRIAKNARIKPWKTRGNAAGSHLEVGDHCVIRAKLAYDRAGARIVIGQRTFMGASLIAVAEAVEIGDDVNIAWGVTIVDHDSHSLDFAKRARDVLDNPRGIKDWSVVAIHPVRICDKAWIGFNVSILKGVTVGEGAVIAACSVVTKDVPAWTLVAGNPARRVRSVFQAS